MGAVLGGAARESASGERIKVARCTRGRVLHAFIEATRDVFGEATLRELTSALPELSAEVDGQDWVPISRVMALCASAETPLGRDADKLRAWARRIIDHSVGRVRRLMLSIATPAGVIRRGPGLWHEDFTDGRVVAYMTSPSSAVASVHDHAFVETELTRDLLAETFRYHLELAGARFARETHSMHPNGALIVELTW